jgi:hypothetical protein
VLDDLGSVPSTTERRGKRGKREREEKRKRRKKGRKKKERGREGKRGGWEREREGERGGENRREGKKERERKKLMQTLKDLDNLGRRVNSSRLAWMSSDIVTFLHQTLLKHRKMTRGKLKTCDASGIPRIRPRQVEK